MQPHEASSGGPVGPLPGPHECAASLAAMHCGLCNSTKVPRDQSHPESPATGKASDCHQQHHRHRYQWRHRHNNMTKWKQPHLHHQGILTFSAHSESRTAIPGRCLSHIFLSSNGNSWELRNRPIESTTKFASQIVRRRLNFLADFCPTLTIPLWQIPNSTHRKATTLCGTKIAMAFLFFIVKVFWQQSFAWDYSTLLPMHGLLTRDCLGSSCHVCKFVHL